jgi:hypothetical protein
MKITSQLVKITLGAIVGSLFLAGCASAPSPQGPPTVENTIDLQDTGPDTHPAWRTDNYDNYQNLQSWDVEAIQ